MPYNRFNQVQVLPILESEIWNAVKQLKAGKSPGADGITSEMVTGGMEELTPVLLKLFNQWIEDEAVPDDLPDATTILLFKKGDPLDISNYRPISLLSSVFKLFTKVLSARMESDLDKAQPEEQAGFRKNYSTTDNIHVVTEILNKAEEYNIPLYCVFIDYRKAFDSVEYNSVWNSLVNQGVNQKWINIMKSIYEKAKTRIKINNNIIEVDIRRGVRQGETLSPKLFSACVEDVFQKIDWSVKGVSINGDRLSHLRFADDIVIFSHTRKQAEEMLQELSNESGQIGLEINRSKTFAMTNRTRRPILLDAQPIQYCDNFIYLGRRVSFDQSTSRELQRRIQSGWAAFKRYEDFLVKRTVPMYLKKRLFHTCIQPAMLYAAESWTMSKKDYDKLAVAQRKMERRIVGVSLLDRRTNEWLRNRTKLKDLREEAVKIKWKWARRIAMMEQSRWAKKITEWRPWAKKRHMGRPRRRWRDDFKEMLGETWMRQADNYAQWKQFMLQHIINM